MHVYKCLWTGREWVRWWDVEHAAVKMVEGKVWRVQAGRVGMFVPVWPQIRRSYTLCGLSLIRVQPSREPRSNQVQIILYSMTKCARFRCLCSNVLAEGAVTCCDLYLGPLVSSAFHAGSNFSCACWAQKYISARSRWISPLKYLSVSYCLDSQQWVLVSEWVPLPLPGRTWVAQVV